jgi:hypothetical protein
MSLRWVVVHHEPSWSGTARAALEMAAALAARDETRVAAPAGSALLARAAEAGLPVVSWPGPASPRAVAAVLAPLQPEGWCATSAAAFACSAASAARAGRGALVRRLALGERPAAPPRRWFGHPPEAAWVFAARADAEKVPVPTGVVRGGIIEPWAAPAPRREPAEPRHVVLVADAAGSATAGSRVHDALRGAAALLRAHREVRLVLLGGCATDDTLRVHAGALGVASQLVSGGAFDDARWIGAAVATWVVADSDDGAYAALTSAAHGVPVLAPRGSAAARLLVPGTTGEAVPGDEPLVAAGVLAHWLGDDARRRTMGQAARERLGVVGAPAVPEVLDRAVAQVRGARVGAA